MFSTLSLILVLAVLVFIVASRLAHGRYALAGGTIAVVYLLLSPALLRECQAFQFYRPPLNALGVLAFVTAWIFMENWSVFMRSIVLALIYGVGLWFQAEALWWIPLAMVPWVLFNRRPIPAVATLVTVLLGGGLFFGMTWTVGSLLAGQPGMIIQPLRDLVLHLQMEPLAIEGLHHHALPACMMLITLPWFLLSLWTAWERFKAVLVDRRADVSAFMALMMGIVILICFTAGPRVLAPGSDLLVAFLALSAPLVSRDLAQREFLFSRSSRIATMLGFIITGTAQGILQHTAPGLLMTRLAGYAVILGAMSLAMGVSRVLQPTQALDIRGHWRAILAGSSLASFLAVNSFFWIH